jgi:hypothetical protein
MPGTRPASSWIVNDRFSHPSSCEEIRGYCRHTPYRLTIIGSTILFLLLRSQTGLHMKRMVKKTSIQTP